MSRFQHIEDEVLQERRAHMPMLKWVAGLGRDRIKRGRIVLLEQGAMCKSLGLDDLAALDGLQDGVFPDAEFQYVRGDQCMLGQADLGDRRANARPHPLGH